MINLIPPQIKQERRVKTVLSHVYLGFGVIATMFLIMATALYLYNSYILADIHKIDDRIADRNKKVAVYKDTEAQIKAINSLLLKMDAADKDRVIWTSILQTIAASTPKTLMVKNLTLNKEAMNASLSGTALTRKDIAMMKEKLEGSTSFKNVTFSTSSFNDSTNDYSFTLTFELTGTAK